jgi:uncharacterized RDD family membrane protein YckC
VAVGDSYVGRKQFFFEKKNQKTFTLGGDTGGAHSAGGTRQRAKVFWFFFPKKNCLLSGLHGACSFTILTAAMSGFVDDVTLTEGVVGRRVLGWCVDALVVGLMLVVLNVLLWIVGFLTFGLGWFLLGGLWVLPIAYMIVFVASPGQATPGQALLGLRVVRDEDLRRPEPAQACVYAILYAVTMWAGAIWLIAAFFTRRARCLHDIGAGVLIARADALPQFAAASFTTDGPIRP